MNKITCLSVVIPVYNEEECLELLHSRLSEVLDKFDFHAEILFINDGSIDKSLDIIKSIQSKDRRVAYLDLSRNYGKETAMKAGIDYITGDALVIIDADLQDHPQLIEKMAEEIKKGYDDVYAQRVSRMGETWQKKITSKLYYQVLKKVSNIPVQENTGDFRMFSQKAIFALKELKESELNMKGLFSYVGFNKKAIYYERDPRIAGKTKWTYLKLITLAIKGLTSFSVAPLRVVSITGVIVSFAAFLFLVFILVQTIFFGNPVSGYPSLIAVILFLGGVQLLALGIIGEYIGIIYSETKKRPLYFVKEYKQIAK